MLRKLSSWSCLEIRIQDKNYNIKTDNETFERVEQLKYFGKPLKNQYYIQKEINSTLKSGNAYYYSVQNIASSSLLPKNIKVTIHRTTVLPVYLYGCETGSLTLRE